MTVGLSSIPLAWAAGVLGVLSPRVWPLVPIVMTSAASAGVAGAWMLGLGLSLSFALAGTVLVVRYFGATLLALAGAVLAVPALADRTSTRLSMLSGRLGMTWPLASYNPRLPAAQFGVGALLGLVWLPCVGPTLGAAVALASLGRDMLVAFVVMFAFGAGTASALLFAGVACRGVLSRWRPGMLHNAERSKKFLGALLLLLGVMVLTSADKLLETLALRVPPGWVFGL